MAGRDVDMQSNLENSKPPVSSQGQYAGRHRVSSLAEDLLLQSAGQADKNQYIASTDQLESLEKFPSAQRLPFQKQCLRRKPSSTLWRLTLIIGDSLVLFASLACIINPAPHVGLPVPGSLFGMWNADLLWMFLLLASWGITVTITQAQQLNCAADLLKSPLYALTSLVLMLICCVFLLYLFLGAHIIPFLKPLFIFLTVAAPILSIWRVSLAEIINLPRFRRQAVIVGVNAAGESVAKEILRAKHPGINVLGYISERTHGQQQPDELPIFGGRSALRSLTQNGMIDMIIMAIDYKAHLELFQEALQGSQWGISVVPVATIYESISGRIPLDYIGDQWSIAYSMEQFVSPLYLCWNKVVDLAFGICGLVMLCVLLPILALFIYLDSPGPIFFSQERAGYHGKTFRILKFRSMRTGSEHVEGGAWTSKDDDRVTRVGRLLRATHFDELPQMLNIVRGNMSLIGPRPERPDYIGKLSRSNPFYSHRLSVRPGLTGWAQVKYAYGSSEQDELIKLQYDLFYIKHRSFLLDVLILLKTVGEVVLCHGV